MTQGNGGFFSIRNVTFPDGYFSPTLANEYGLDFVVAFYHNNVLVSASLINAYTISGSRLSFMGAKFVNKYNDGSKINDGNRIPTLLNLYGHLSLTEFPTQGVSSFEIFLPPTISIDTFT